MYITILFLSLIDLFILLYVLVHFMGFFTRCVQVPAINLLNKLFGIPYQYSVIYQTCIDSNTLFPLLYINPKKCDSDCEDDCCNNCDYYDEDDGDDCDNKCNNHNQLVETYSNDQYISTDTEEEPETNDDTNVTEEESNSEDNSSYKYRKVLINEPLD